MYVLGLNSVYHESCACLLDDGRLVAIAEEERFNRRKHGKKPFPENPDELPLHAMDYCLQTAGIDVTQVDRIGYSSSPQARLAAVAEQGQPWPDFFTENIQRVPARLAELGFAGEFHWVDHHEAHAASTFFASPFEEAAILSIDGIGDVNTAAAYHGCATEMKLVQQVVPPNSIGFLWELVSMFLGFDIYDATKIMGLAAYGDPQRFKKEFGQLVRLVPDGKFEVNNELTRFDQLDYRTPTGYFAGLAELFGTRKRSRDEDLQQVHQDISAALQEVTDALMQHMVDYLHEQTGSRNLCLAGGVALNCVTNQRIFELGPYEQLYIQPAAHDAGTAIGCAYHIWHQRLGQPRGQAMTSPYCGPEFTGDQIEAALGRHGLKYRRCEQLETEVARLISEGNVVGWLQGRMEVGPRALGNRSLLADPRRPDMRDMLNHKVKHREHFRPFAPSVLHEEARNWFQIEKETSAAEFMLMAYPAHESVREQIPAVLHCDGTSRVQTVRSEVNPRYHRLISEFHRLTGVPLVLNTSFNDSEPIVCTPDDAVHTFMKTGIDYLAVGDFLLSKVDNPGPPPPLDLPRPVPLARVWPTLQEGLQRAVSRHRVSHIDGRFVLTDSIGREEHDQVLPLFAEQQFFLDQLDRERVRGARVLEIGLGSGVLSIALARGGARKVTALEINSRAMIFAGFNILLGGCEDLIEIRAGDDDLYRPVAGERFDLVISNPPFLPTAPGADYYRHSAAGKYGLEFTAKLFAELDEHLADGGRAQFVTVAPGNKEEPFLLRQLAEEHLSGGAMICVNTEPGSFREMVSFLNETGAGTREQMREMLKQAKADGVTHTHLCVVHYDRAAEKSVRWEKSSQTYAHWQWPLAGWEQG